MTLAKLTELRQKTSELLNRLAGPEHDATRAEAQGMMDEIERLHLEGEAEKARSVAIQLETITDFLLNAWDMQSLCGLEERVALNAKIIARAEANKEFRESLYNNRGLILEEAYRLYEKRDL
jgi:hypothetical protein